MNYNPLNVLLLMVWIYSGCKALELVFKYRFSLGNVWEKWFNFASLGGGPLVLGGIWFFLQSRESLRQLEPLLHPAADNDAPEAEIEIRDNHGKTVLENAEDENVTPEALFVIRRMIYDLFIRNAADLFFDPKPNGTAAVTFRIGERRRHMYDLNILLGNFVTAALKKAAGLDVDEQQKPQEGRLQFSCNGQTASFRVTSVGAFGGEKVMLHRLDADTTPLSLTEAGVDGELLKTLESLNSHKSGLVLLAGPREARGALFYALLRTFDREKRNLITVEKKTLDRLFGTIQLEGSKDADSYVQQLLTAIRMKPDILFVSDLEDRRITETVFHAIHNGILVVAGIDAASCSDALDQLVRREFSLTEIATVLELIVCTRSLRTLCRNCAKPAVLNAEYQHYFEQAGLESGQVHRAIGCAECGRSGYSGITAVFDHWAPGKTQRTALVAGNLSYAELKSQLEQKHGASLLAYETFKKVAAGITSLAEAERSL